MESESSTDNSDQKLPNKMKINDALQAEQPSIQLT